MSAGIRGDAGGTFGALVVNGVDVLKFGAGAVGDPLEIAKKTDIPASAPAFGEQAFTTSGTFTVPAGVSRIKVTVIGGGGGGSGYNTQSGGSGGPGGIGIGVYDVVAGQQYAVTVGLGGAGSNGSSPGGTGGTSSFGALLSATGGAGGIYNGLLSTFNTAGTATGANRVNTNVPAFYDVTNEANYSSAYNTLVADCLKGVMAVASYTSVTPRTRTVTLGPTTGDLKSKVAFGCPGRGEGAGSNDAGGGMQGAVHVEWGPHI